MLRADFSDGLGCVLDDLPGTECLGIGAIVHFEFGELQRLIDVERIQTGQAASKGVKRHREPGFRLCASRQSVASEVLR